MSTYLYIIGVIDGPVKIGFTANPSTRLGAIRTACPYDAQMLACFRAESLVPDFERFVHFALREQKIRGEWFSVNAEKAQEAVAQAAIATNFPLAPVDLNTFRVFIPPITDEEEAQIQRQIAADPDAPEATNEELARFKPFAEALPDLAESIKRCRGRPRAEKPKAQVTLRLDQDVIAKFKASGPG